MEWSNVLMVGGREEITDLVSQRTRVDGSMILPFGDFPQVLEELLRHFYTPGAHLAAGGHVTPDIELAATHAEVDLVEALGQSPFAADVGSVVSAVRSPRDLVYVAYPNRVTGAGFTASELEQLARAVPQGLLLVDEFYFDYFGITALALTDLLTNVIVFRSFAGPLTTPSCDAGYLLANAQTVRRIRNSLASRPLTTTMCKSILSSLIGEEELDSHLHLLHDESLRLATALNRLNVQCRLTPTDFLLLRVADPARVIDYLAGFGLNVDNLDGYPLLKHYLRYRVQPAYVNDRLADAFRKMPPELYRMKSTDRSPLRLRRVESETPTKHQTVRGQAGDPEVVTRAS
ncbi:MAG: aminotransferase class I/II-fold pyridoxal phosphate-dependent enzyme, partial [Candidatus Zixiibacteriota bacterium]